MYPILFQIGQFSFSSIGVSLSLGFFICFFICWRRLRELGFNEEKIVDSFLLASLSGFIFARIIFALANWPRFGFNLAAWLYFPSFPGFSLWGAMSGFFVGFWFFSKKEKWSFYKLADQLVFGICLFALFAQIGMFLDGSNLGKETSALWGLYFPGDMVRRQPVSLFEAIFYLGIGILLLKIERAWRGWEWYKSQKDGFLFFLFFILLGFFKFSLAFLKPVGVYSSLVEKIVGLIIGGAFLGWGYWASGRQLSEDFSFFKKITLFNKREQKNGQKTKR
ncbi:prolipoprotein diacylglyceryl transferase [Patescibacteria group bacterium]